MSPEMLVLLYAVGLALILLELVTPGVIMGLIGVSCLGFAVYETFVTHGAVAGAVACACTVATVVGVFVYAIRRLTVYETQEVSDGYTSEDPRDAALVGKEGVSTSQLRPAGLATICERRVDVVTRGELLDSGTKVKVIAVEGNRVVVKALG